MLKRAGQGLLVLGLAMVVFGILWVIWTDPTKPFGSKAAVTGFIIGIAAGALLLASAMEANGDKWVPADALVIERDENGLWPEWIARFWNDYTEPDWYASAGSVYAFLDALAAAKGADDE